ncbi:ADP/ATP-dependent (S)-NAD(P)H-hydrate dehydratase [Naasia sp. SYSU D00057]|uniref:ADP-dependent NAD(P)H-hydrate dehydratase n=1 Tax=Naasia sp. SYSU D00057 TaxID=2817380 RepID=UPI001B310999|nr:ADP/ATP-dependent (S)-NAD(P)H-hydrate dehydratase [Naasia sp. SYSU D00057]
MTAISGWTDADTAAEYRVPVPGDDKYSRGVVGILTGSARYPGAAVLGVEGAARAGTGMIRYLGDEGAARFVLQRRPEAVTAPGRVQAWVIGSGMDAEQRSGELREQIEAALSQGLPVVLDAGALDLARGTEGPTLVTPHAGELAKLLGDRGVEVERRAVEADGAGWAARAAELLGVTVLLKGSTTFVVRPDGSGHRLQAGPAWLATAGSGDVLAGILGALAAARSDDLVADPARFARVAAAGAWLHGRAGERASGGGPLVALDIAEALPGAIAALLHDS